MWIFGLKRLRAEQSAHYSVGSEDFRNSPATRSDGDNKNIKNNCIPVLGPVYMEVG